MDMKCFNCGEPWDWWYLREDVIASPDGRDLYPSIKKDGGEVDGFTFSSGPYVQRCPACPKGETEYSRSEESFLLAGLADILGDDIDGFMAEAEDFGLI